jgi:sodium transport system permease protein
VQTGSLIPCVLFHMTYNGIGFASAMLPDVARERPSLDMLFHQMPSGEVLYNWPVIAICAAAAILPLMWLQRLPYQATREEQIGEARARQPHHPLAASATSTAD